MFGAAPPAAVTTTYSSSNTGTLRSSTKTGTTSTTGPSTFASTTSSTRNTARDIASLLSLHKTLGARLHHSPSDRVLPLQREALNLELALAFRNNVAGRSGGGGGGRGSGDGHDPTQEDQTRFSPTGPLRSIKTGGAIIRPGAASHQADAEEEDFDVDNFHSVLKRTLPKPLECDWSTEMGRAAAREVLQIKSLGEKEGGRSLKHSPQYQNLDKRFLLDKLLLEGDSANRSSWVAEPHSGGGVTAMQQELNTPGPSISSEPGPQNMLQLSRAPVPTVSSAPPFLPQQQSTQHHSGPPPVVAAAPAVPFYAEMPTSVGGSAYPYQFELLGQGTEAANEKQWNELRADVWPGAFIDGGDSRWMPATNMEPRQVLTGLQRPLVPLAAVEGDEGDRGDEDGKYDTLVHEYFHVPSGAAGGGLKMSTMKTKSSSAWPGGKARPGDGSLQRGSEASLSLQSLLSKRSTSAGSVLLGKIEENDESKREKLLDDRDYVVETLDGDPSETGSAIKVKPKDNSCKNKKNRFNRKNLHSATVDTPAAARPVDRIGSGGSASIPRNGPFLKFHAGP
eukprot:g6475.t1